MEQLARLSITHVHDDEMARLHADAAAGRTSEFLEAWAVWASSQARADYDLALEDARDVGLAAISDVQRRENVLELTWPELKDVTEDQIPREAARRLDLKLFGPSNLPEVMREILRGASAVRPKDVSSVEDAVTVVWLRVQRTRWYRDGEGRPSAYYRRAGRNAALDLVKQQAKWESFDPDADVRARVAASAEDEALARVVLPGLLEVELTEGRAEAERVEATRVQAQNRLLDLIAADPSCLYHGDGCPRFADFVNACSDALPTLVSLDDYWLLLEPLLAPHRQQFGADRTGFWRRVRRCAQWITYEVFRFTAADTAGSEGNPTGSVDQDPLRWEVCHRWALTAGAWNSQYAPIRRVRPLVASDALFTPLLAMHKPDVARELRLTMTDETSGVAE